jgi:hypothetical protein
LERVGLKYIFLTLSLVLTFSSSSAESVDVFTGSLEKFKATCMDQNGNLRNDVLVKDELYSCRDEYKYLMAEFEEREKLMTQHPEVYEKYNDCIAKQNEPKVTSFAEQGEDIAEEVSCLKEEAKEVEKDCSESWQCNKYRTILDVADVLPRVIEKPIRNYITGQANSKGYSKSCLNDDKSNCMEDFMNALVDSLWTSVTSIKDLAVAGAKSLFNMFDFFDSEAEKNIVKMEQSVEDVESFMDSPGKWISDFIDKIKTGVVSWIKSSVFCQEWKYNSEFAEGEAPASTGVARTCVKPLEDFGCIDCEDMIDATCIALGGLTAEVGVAFFTAGVGTAASFGARASAKGLAVASSKVLSKINTRMPKFAKSSKANKIDKSKAAIMIGNQINKSTEIAKKIYSVSTASAKAMKDKMDAIKFAIQENKVVKVTSNIIEKGNIPAMVSNKIAEKGAVAGAKITSKVAKGSIKKEADLIVKASQKTTRTKRAQGIIDDKTHGKERVVGHTTKSNKVYQRGSRAKERAAEDKRKKLADEKRRDEARRKEELAEQKRKDEAERKRLAQEKRDEEADRKRIAREKREEEARRKRELAEQKKKDQDQKLADQKKKDQEQRLAEQKKKEREQKLAEQKKKEQEKKLAEQKKKEEQDKREKLIKLGVAGVVTDLAAKGITLSDREARKEMDRLERASKENDSAKATSLKNAKETLGVEGKSAFSDGAMKQAENLKQMYSESNRDSVVSGMQKSNPGMTRDTAQKAFSRRQSEVNNAYDYINKTAGLSSSQKAVAQRTKERKNLEAELKEIKKQGKIQTLSSELENLKTQRQEIESLGKQVSSNPASEGTVASLPTSSSEEALSTNRSRPPSRTIAPTTQTANSASSRALSTSAPVGSSSSVESSAREIASTPEVDQEAVGVDSLEDVEENGIEDSSEEVAQVSEELDEERLDRKKSENLKDLLGLISNKGVQIKTNVAVDLDLTTVISENKQTQERLDRLSDYVKRNEKADKLVSYPIEKGRLEVYHFDKEKFSFAISEDGVTKIIDEGASRTLIENSVSQVE